MKIFLEFAWRETNSDTLLLFLYFLWVNLWKFSENFQEEKPTMFKPDRVSVRGKALYRLTRELVLTGWTWIFFWIIYLIKLDRTVGLGTSKPVAWLIQPAIRFWNPWEKHNFDEPFELKYIYIFIGRFFYTDQD